MNKCVKRIIGGILLMWPLLALFIFVFWGLDLKEILYALGTLTIVFITAGTGAWLLQKSFSDE